jgi:hypothetical protein
MDRIPNRSERKSRCLCLTTGGADRLSLPERSQDRQLAPFLVSSHLLSRSKAITLRVFPNTHRLFLFPREHNLCLDCA